MGLSLIDNKIVHVSGKHLNCLHIILFEVAEIGIPICENLRCIRVAVIHRKKGVNKVFKISPGSVNTPVKRPSFM